MLLVTHYVVVMQSAVTRKLDNLGQRLWLYQAERFPVVMHGLLIAAFTSSGVSLSAVLCGVMPKLSSYIVAFISTFILFLQLRIADEFKDNEEDCRYRPYRPVPRGLVSLVELGTIGVVGACLQFVVTFMLAPKLLLLLAVNWLYLYLMTREFFISSWLKAHPVIYMGSHMLIMPLIDAYITGCNWEVTEGKPPAGLLIFLAVSFFNGMVIEIGRKLRRPQDEEKGVETYSALWGLSRASLCWLGMLTATALLAVATALYTNLALPTAGVATLALGFAWHLRKDVLAGLQPASRFELFSGVWTIVLYVGLGLAPLLVSLWR